MINMSTYGDHDVDADPIIFLPCGHFFAMSTMDGVIEIGKVYESGGTSGQGHFVGLKSLRGLSNISEKSKQCPDCRSIVHSIKRYGRILRLIELRGLERKHMAMADQALKINEKRAQEMCSSSASSSEVKTKQSWVHLIKVEELIRKSPMNVVFEACGGSSHVEAAPPPAQQLIRCLELKGLVADHWASKFEDAKYRLAKDAYRAAIQVADESKSRLSGAKRRLCVARLILKYCTDVDANRDEIKALLDWIAQESRLPRTHELVSDAQTLQEELTRQNSLEIIKSVMGAMNVVSGYNYGTSASAHWFECPNGHPYFIGECGGAMLRSACPECGEVVGGESHSLHGTNRPVSGIFRDALSG